MSARPLKEAQVTTVTKEVQLVDAQAVSKPAAINDVVGAGTIVRTGAESRAELTFADRTIARLAANSAFTFNPATRDMKLEDGAMLFQVPRGSGGARIGTGNVTAAIHRATGIAEFHPNSYFKFLILEGEARICVNHRMGESVILRPGQLLISKADSKVLPESAYFNIGRFMNSCRLVLDFSPLAEHALAAINHEAARQKNNSDFVPTNLVIFGSGTNVVLVNPDEQNAGGEHPADSGQR